MIMRDTPQQDFDLVILGLGYESRSTFTMKNRKFDCECIALGYSKHCKAIKYPENKAFFKGENVTIFEGDDGDVFDFVRETLERVSSPRNVLLDISVLSRHRLSTIMVMLLNGGLPKGSTLTVIYSISKYVSAPTESTPVAKVAPITEALSGPLNRLDKPLSLIIGLGYEKNKALGIFNYFDCKSDLVFTLIPESKENLFRKDVEKNNRALLSTLTPNHILEYDTHDPYNTYLDLKAIFKGIEEYTRPIVIPLGPKILSAISVVVALEFHPFMPVWRVSSEHTEEPVDRKPSGDQICFTVELD